MAGSGKVPGQVLNDRFRGRFRTTFRTTGSRKVSGQVLNHGFREGSGAGSERQVPGRFRVSFSNHQEVSGAGSDSRVPGRVRFMFEYSTYIVTMGMDMNEWLIAWIVLLKAVRAVCAPKCF